MKRAFFCLAFLVAINATAQNSARDTFDRRYGIKRQTPEQVAQERKAQADEILIHGDNSFRRFSDGSVAGLNKCVYQHYGVIPGNTPKGVEILTEWKVLDVSERGIRASPVFVDGTMKDIFIEGLTGFTDRTYSGTRLIKFVGSYTYETVLGGSRTIPKYEIGEKITQEEFVKEITKGVAPAVSRNITNLTKTVLITNEPAKK